MARRALLAAALLLVPGVLVACGGDEDEAGSDPAAAGGPTTEVVLTDEGCDPAALSVTAGKNTFHVTNRDAAGVTEFEILDGSKIIAEVEGVAAGLDRTLDVDLKAGSYVTYCPGGATEKGTLTVTAG